MTKSLAASGFNAWREQYPQRRGFRSQQNIHSCSAHCGGSSLTCGSHTWHIQPLPLNTGATTQLWHWCKSSPWPSTLKTIHTQVRWVCIFRPSSKFSVEKSRWAWSWNQVFRSNPRLLPSHGPRAHAHTASFPSRSSSTPRGRRAPHRREPLLPAAAGGCGVEGTTPPRKCSLALQQTLVSTLNPGTAT